MLGLRRYAADPRLLGTVFHDDSQVGEPSDLGAGFLEDTAQLWLPGEYDGGVLTYNLIDYPILTTEPQRLLVEGDLTLATDPDGEGYRITPPDVARVAAYLTKHVQANSFLVESSFALMPTRFPAFTIRLERDSQSDAYVGDLSHEAFRANGDEERYTRRDIEGQYLISIWTANREECLWLYAWLLHWFLMSQDLLARWGLYNTSMTGSDIDPLMQFLPTQTFARHFLFVATRQERVLSLTTPELVTTLGIDLTMFYQRFKRLPDPLP